MLSRTTEEKRQGNHTYYVVSEYDGDGHPIGSKRIVYHLIKSLKTDDAFTIFIFDDNGIDLKKAYHFLNDRKAGIADSSRLALAKELRVFFDYADIIEKPLNQFNYTDFIKLSGFLEGHCQNSPESIFYLDTDKNVTSVNSILRTLQQYLKYCRSQNQKIIDRVVTKSAMPRGKNSECPRFISYADMMRIHRYTLNDASLSEETRKKYDVIYRMMFDCGLRIGECLGATVEDFKAGYNSEGELVHYFIVRNRASDRLSQHAKRCMQTKSKVAYESPNYRIKNYGYQEVLIPETLYTDIMDYYDKATMRFYREDRYMPEADSVTSDDKNYYIFANENVPTPLDKRVFSIYTRSMFEAVGLSVDTEKRDLNLFHRFRHGFCMWLIYVKKMPLSQAIIYTRHRDVSGVQPYLNPTPEMIREVIEQAQEGIDVYAEY